MHIYRAWHMESQCLQDIDDDIKETSKCVSLQKVLKRSILQAVTHDTATIYKVHWLNIPFVTHSILQHCNQQMKQKL